MKLIRRQHLVATIFPANMLDIVRQQSQAQAPGQSDEVVFLTGGQQISGQRVRLITDEFVRQGRTVRVVRTL